MDFGRLNPRIHYWQEGGQEVDFVLQQPGGLIRGQERAPSRQHFGMSASEDDERSTARSSASTDFPKRAGKSYSGAFLYVASKHWMYKRNQ